MSPPADALRREANRIVAWAAVLPALAAWPILSALPAFSLLGGPPSLLAGATQAVLLASGFWGVAGVQATLWLLRTPAQRSARSESRPARGLLVGAYATIWTGIYILVAGFIDWG